MLALALAVVAISARARLEAGPDITVLGYPLPKLCQWKGLLGVECAGCGLTHSFVAIAHGEVARAFAHHRVGPWLFVLLALQIPYRALVLARPDWEARWGRHAGWGWWIAVALMGYAIAAWAVNGAFWASP